MHTLRCANFFRQVKRAQVGFEKRIRYDKRAAFRQDSRACAAPRAVGDIAAAFQLRRPRRHRSIFRDEHGIACGGKLKQRANKSHSQRLNRLVRGRERRYGARHRREGRRARRARFAYVNADLSHMRSGNGHSGRIYGAPLPRVDENRPRRHRQGDGLSAHLLHRHPRKHNLQLRRGDIARKGRHKAPPHIPRHSRRLKRLPQPDLRHMRGT